jgi:RsiW-degrading membrane proteinase PrsW (M82 family)
VILYSTLALCALGAATLVYRYDLYDREPLPALGRAAILGAAAMALAGPAELLTLRFLGTEGPLALAAVAAFEEETLKLLVVLLLAVFASRVFNDPMDGLIYGSMVGLGAALEEGVAVLRHRAGEGPWLPPEELVRMCGHLVMGGIGGFGVGRARFRQPGWPLALGLGLLAALSLHFGWDFLALRAEPLRAGPSRQALLGAALMLAGMLLYGRLVVVASRWSRRFFSPESTRALES